MLGFFILLVVSIAVTLLAHASLQDFKTGEIEDLVTLSFVRLVFLMAIVAALVYWDLNLLLEPLYFGSVFFLAAYLFYCLRQTGGADVVLAGGVGSALGLLDALGFSWTQYLIPIPHYLKFSIMLGVVCLLYLPWMMYKKQKHIRFAPFFLLAFLMTIL